MTDDCSWVSLCLAYTSCLETAMGIELEQLLLNNRDVGLGSCTVLEL